MKFILEFICDSRRFFSEISSVFTIKTSLGAPSEIIPDVPQGDTSSFFMIFSRRSFKIPSGISGRDFFLGVTSGNPGKSCFLF